MLLSKDEKITWEWVKTGSPMQQGLKESRRHCQAGAPAPQHGRAALRHSTSEKGRGTHASKITPDSNNRSTATPETPRAARHRQLSARV